MVQKQRDKETAPKRDEDDMCADVGVACKISKQ